MTTVETLEDDVRRLTNQLVHARACLEKGEAIDLSLLEPRADEICKALTRLSKDDSRSLQGALLSIIEELNTLELALKSGLEQIRSQIGEATERRRALNAYNQQKP